MSPDDPVTIPRYQFEAWEKEVELAGHAKRLAMELECVLLAMRDPQMFRWWNSAMEALGQYQEAVDRLYRRDGEPTMDELANQLETRSSP